METDRLNKFIENFNIYINIEVRNVWKFRETYRVSINKDMIILMSDEKISQLQKILSINEYLNIFKKNIFPAFSEIFPDINKYGIYIYFINRLTRNGYYPSINIMPKKLLYFDLILKDLLIIILSF